MNNFLNRRCIIVSTIIFIIYCIISSYCFSLWFKTNALVRENNILLNKLESNLIIDSDDDRRIEFIEEVDDLEKSNRQLDDLIKICEQQQHKHDSIIT